MGDKTPSSEFPGQNGYFARLFASLQNPGGRLGLLDSSSLLGGAEKEEMESDNEGIEKTRPRACLRRFLQTGFAINQFKLAELDDTLVVLLEIHRRTVLFGN